MTKEQKYGKIIEIVKKAIADNTVDGSGEDDIITLDCNDVDHIAEEVAEEVYDLYTAVFDNEIKSLKRGIKELQDENAGLNRECNDYLAEVGRLKKENANLLKVCEEKFTFNTTANKTYSVFNSVRKEFAEKLKKVIYERDYIQGYVEIGLVKEIDELLKEYK